MDRTRSAPTRALRAVDEAALTLHAPHLEAGDVTKLLEDAVVDLQLADSALFIPAVVEPLADVRPAADEREVLADVRRPDGILEGLLRYRPRSRDAEHAVRVLAAHAGVALGSIARVKEIEQREEAVRRVAERLQDALLPDLPQLPATNLDVRYRAAAREARVGGDFYDAFPLPDGRILLLVGDVVGKGVEAASRTSLITQTCRALALQGLQLDALLERVDEQVSFQDPEMMATIWCALYDPASGELAFASLGHPPALLTRAHGEPIYLTLQGLPLGLRDLAPDPPEIRTRKLESRDLLVLYTDGVVESSGDLLAGQQALLEAIQAHRDETLATIITSVLDELLADAGHTDDALMLLLRRR